MTAVTNPQHCTTKNRLANYVSQCSLFYCLISFIQIASIGAGLIFILLAINHLYTTLQAHAVSIDHAVSSNQNTGVSFIPHSLTDTTLVSTGATWKYLDDGSDQGTAWYGTTFDDNAWASGPAELGYGDGDEATVVSYGSDPNNKYITTYFRHSFNVADASVYKGLLLRILRDDGAVVYLNGAEAFRTNMPAGTVSYITPASSAVYTHEAAYFSAMVDPGNLVSGTNVIAVEIHQAYSSSSDISFNLELTGITGLGSCTGTTVNFAVIGDFGKAGQAELDVANLVKSWNPDFIITVGDNNYPNGESATIDDNIGQYYHEFIGNYVGSYGSGAADNKFYPTLGNHDWYAISTGLPQPYLDYFTLPNNERYYNFIRGPVEFFAIDSDSNEPDGRSSTLTQATWLQNQLAASSAPWKLVYMHHAPYSSSSAHGSDATMQWPYQAWSATAVLAGHDHTYERILIGGLPYFVNGLGGSPYIYSFGTSISGSVVRYRDNHGAMLVKANSDCISFQFISRTGTVIDTYTINGNASLTYTFLPLIHKN